jgi:hypothetical protein
MVVNLLGTLAMEEENSGANILPLTDRHKHSIIYNWPEKNEQNQPRVCLESALNSRFERVAKIVLDNDDKKVAPKKKRKGPS